MPPAADSVAVLAARLKRARLERGMSIRGLCEASGITSTAVAWRAENGRDVAFSVAARLAAARGVSLDGTAEPPSVQAPDGGSESAGGG